MAHRFEDTLEKDGLLHQPNDIILPDNRVKMVAMEQYTLLYEFHSFVVALLACHINLFKNIPSSSFSKDRRYFASWNQFRIQGWHFRTGKYIILFSYIYMMIFFNQFCKLVKVKRIIIYYIIIIITNILLNLMKNKIFILYHIVHFSNNQFDSLNWLINLEYFY